MNDSKTTSRIASAAVVRFLKDATPGQKEWYMAQGEPSCFIGHATDPDGMRRVMYPCLRGIMVGKPAASVEEAVAEARRFRNELLAKEGLEPVDEVELGIDDEAHDLEDLFSEQIGTIQQIAHVATMANCDRGEVLTMIMRDVIDALGAGCSLSLIDDLPCLRPLVEHSRECAEDGDGRTRDDLVDDAIMMMRDAGAMGFLVLASHPDIGNVRGDSFSIHGHTYETDIFYGSTYAMACRKAVAWFDRTLEEMRNDPKRQAKNP
jgi:hypothetical protein